MATKSQGNFQSSTATSTPSGYNSMMKIGPSSAAAANALNQRTGRGRRGGGLSSAQKSNFDSKVQFGKDFATAFGKNLGTAALETGKSIARSPFRVASSLAEIPKVYKSGGSKTSDPYNIPGLGQIKTYAREAQDKIKEGDGSKLTTAATILGVGGQSMLDVAALGSAAQGAKKFFVKGDGSTSQATNVMRKFAPKTAAKFDQLTYRPYRGAPMGWQLRAQKSLNLPFWKMNPNL